MDSKQCNSCKKTKPVSAFCKASDTRDGLQRACRICSQAASAAWKKTPKGVAWRRAHQSTPEYRAAQYKRSKRLHRATKVELFNLLCGGVVKCQCPGCGIAEPEFLQLDHLNNDGAAERRRLSNCGGHRFYRLALKDPNRASKYQVLCANCNHAKGRFNGRCPVHQP